MSAKNDRASKYRKDPRSTDEFPRSRPHQDADRDNEDYWQMLPKLAALGIGNQDEVQAAMNRCPSPPP